MLYYNGIDVLKVKTLIKLVIHINVSFGLTYTSLNPIQDKGGPKSSPPPRPPPLSVFPL